MKDCNHPNFDLLVEPDHTGAIVVCTECKEPHFIPLKDFESFKKTFPNLTVKINKTDQNKITSTIQLLTSYEDWKRTKSAKWNWDTLNAPVTDIIQQFLSETGITVL